MPTSSWAQWQGRTVMNSGDVLAIYSGTAVVHFWISGYLLE
jgi:hypothetical protein